MGKIGGEKSKKKNKKNRCKQNHKTKKQSIFFFYFSTAFFHPNIAEIFLWPQYSIRPTVSASFEDALIRLDSPPAVL